jgi:hypothetical protein
VDNKSFSRLAFTSSSVISFPGIPIWPGTQRRVTFSLSSSSSFLSDSVFGFFESISPSTGMSVLRESVMITRRSIVLWVKYIALTITSCSAL